MGHFENIRSEVHPEGSMTSASPIGGSLVPIAVIRAPEGLCTVDRRATPPVIQNLATNFRDSLSY
jgi:hypothetical protein